MHFEVDFQLKNMSFLKNSQFTCLKGGLHRKIHDFVHVETKICSDPHVPDQIRARFSV